MAKLNVSVTRDGFKELLLENPNAFGHFPMIKLPKLIEPAINSSYEELECVSYHPETQELRAVIKLKQPNGYGGGVCTDGSIEYVRFFVDYNDDGNWVDEGLAVTNVHSLGFKEDLCYAVRLRITPDVRRTCSDAPVLPKVRAILAWNQEPTAGNPNFHPHWGDIREVHIQIAPRTKFIFQNVFPVLIKLPVISSVFKTTDYTVASGGTEKVNFGTLIKTYGKTVEHSRSAITAVHALMNTKSTVSPSSYKSLAAYKIDVKAVTSFLNTSKFNTSFEELTCVALNRELNELHGVIHVTRPSGYMGNLCTKGSKEYVAFYMDFGAGWEYMGTSNVAVHDIPTIPKDGLWYNAFIPVDLTKHQKDKCVAGHAKVRGILSWNIVPTPNDPNFVAPWGDWEECNVEVKPLPSGVTPMFPKPLLESVGGIQVSAINQSTGLATGQSTIVPAIHGNNSPFDGSIVITGLLPFAPEGEKYEIHIKYPGSGSFVKWTVPFNVTLMSWNAGTGEYDSTPVNQTVDANNAFTYRNNGDPTQFKHVVGDVLAVFASDFEGKHEVKIVRPSIVDPATRESATAVFYVEKSTVQVSIAQNLPAATPDAGCEDCLCGDYVIGTAITGTFGWSGNFFGAVSLGLAPACSHNHTPVFTQMLMDGNPSNDNVIAYPLSITANTWSLDTTDMCRCGYTVHIYGVNRTIMHSSYVGKQDSDATGFCLRKA